MRKFAECHPLIGIVGEVLRRVMLADERGKHVALAAKARGLVRERSGWFLLALVLYVSSIQFLLFGLVSEVVVRIYFYGQAKPYLVRKVSPRIDGEPRS